MLRRFGRFVAAYTSILLVVLVLCYVASPRVFVEVWYGAMELAAVAALLAIAPAVWLSGWKRDLLLKDRATDKEAAPHFEQDG